MGGTKVRACAQSLSHPFKVADKEGCPGSSVSLQVVNWLDMLTAEAAGEPIDT